MTKNVLVWMFWAVGGLIGGLVAGSVLAHAGFSAIPIVVLCVLLLIPLGASAGFLRGNIVVFLAYTGAIMAISWEQPTVWERVPVLIWVMLAGIILDIGAIGALLFMGRQTHVDGDK